MKLYTHHYTTRERYADAVRWLMFGASEFILSARGKDENGYYYVCFWGRA
jgi:hypothetical protein